MKNCYLCNAELSGENAAQEHILLNAIGGRLKSKELLCKTCNSNFGDSCDTALAGQLNFLGNLLEIERERGEPQPIMADNTATGQEFEIQKGGKPTLPKPDVEKEEVAEGVRYQISARSMNELRGILKGIQKKNPKLDIEEAVRMAEKQEEYLNDQLHFEAKVGGPEALRSICKTAINFFLLKTGEKASIEHLLDYIKQSSDGLPAVVHHFEHCGAIHEVAEEEVSHLIYLKGDPESSILYCVVEFFNSFTFLVKLNSKYQGSAIEECYCFDVLSRAEVSKTVSIGCSPQFLKNFEYQHCQKNRNALIERLNRVIGIACERQDRKHRQGLIQRAMESSLMKHPNGTVLTEEMVNEFIQELIKGVAPYLARRRR